MRRAELIAGIEEVRRALAESGLETRLTTLFLGDREARDEAAQEQLLAALKTFAVCSERFDPAARRLAEALRLDVLSEPSTWVRLLARSDRRLVRLLHERVRVVTEHLPALIGLLDAGGPAEGDHARRLRIVLAGEDGGAVAPRRIAAAMQSSEGLCEIVAQVLGRNADPPTVGTCDAGADVVFDLFGDEAVVGAVRTLLRETADRLVFFRTLPVDERIERATTSLDVYDRIAEERSGGQLGAEQAELWRRRLREHVAALLRAGAFTSEMAEHTRFDLRDLVGPAPRLLAERGEKRGDDAGERPWTLSPMLPTRTPSEPAAAEADEPRERPVFEHRVAYLLDEIQRPARREEPGE